MMSRMFVTQRLLARLVINRTAICSSNHVTFCNARQFASSSGTKLFDKDDEFMKKYSNSASQASSDTNIKSSMAFEDAAIVKTTGVFGKEGDHFQARIGVFWGHQDPMNVYRSIEIDKDTVISSPLAELDSVNMALRQAVYERGLNRVIVKTDSEFVVKVADRWLKNWKANDFMKKDGTPVKNRPYLEELDRLLSMIEAKIVFEHHKTFYDNGVLNALRHNENLGPIIDAEQGIFTLAATIEPADGDNVIFTSGAIRDNSSKYKQFVLAGYGIHWPAKNQVDTGGRFAEFPVTLFRAQMYAIIEALKLAEKHGLTSVQIVTDSDRFLRFYRLNWLKKDGNPVANYPLYKKILEAQKGLEVKFSYMPPKYNQKMEYASMLAEEGFAYPVENKSA